MTPTGVEPLTGRLPTSNPFFWEAEGYVAPEPRVVASAPRAPKPAGMAAAKGSGAGAAGGGGAVASTKGFAAGSSTAAKKAPTGKKAAKKKKRKK